METILRLLTEVDSAAVIDDLMTRPDPVAACKAIHQAMRETYWKRKDLAATVTLGRIGIQFALAAGGQHGEALRGAAKAMCYDLASFTWPGWDEKGIAITASDLAVGLDAGRANLRLARELNKGNLPLSRACWMLAGQYLARRDYALAREHFGRGAACAVAAGSKADELLGLGFAALTDLVSSSGDSEAQRRVEEIKGQLKSEKDGEMFIKQIETAGMVFGAH